jgi:multidrug efflux pump subunit AcrA (membrane-fusion protein)
VGAALTGAVNFKVTIELTGADENVLPGMTAAVNITIEQLDDVLLVLNRAVRLRDGKPVVYMLENGVPMPREIELGSTSEEYTQVLSEDFQAGDVVVLNPPTMDFTGPGGMGGGPGGPP